MNEKSKTAKRKLSNSKKNKSKLLFLALKNEAPFIVEWVAYHIVIGFDRIVIYSNDCDDGSAEILDALAAGGIIEHYSHCPDAGISAQSNAARLANERDILSGAAWGMWLDADEFLVVSTGDRTVDALIDIIGDGDGMLIPWRLMGDGGNDRFSGRLVSENFVDAAAAESNGNLRLKTFFRNGAHIEGLALHGIHRPKVRRGHSPNDFSFLSATGNTLDFRHRPHMRWLTGEDWSRTSKVFPPEHGYALAQINHYSVRTPEHFALKRDRGRGWQADQEGGQNKRHTVDFYGGHNPADVIDRRILIHEAAVSEKITELMENPDLTAAVADAEAKHVTRMTKVSKEFVDGCVAARPARKEPSVFALSLPEEEAKLLRSKYTKGKVVLEYGSGGSSFVALESGVKSLFTVESDRSWALAIHDALQAAHPTANFTVNYSDIGPTGAWGKPVSMDGAANYSRYPNGVWDLSQFQEPDVVLIDGRFRVACFLTTLFRTKKPVTVLFDDYLERSGYHWIERYVKPTKIVGRMAMFRVKPMAIPGDDLTLITQTYANSA